MAESYPGDEVAPPLAPRGGVNTGSTRTNLQKPTTLPLHGAKKVTANPSPDATENIGSDIGVRSFNPATGEVEEDTKALMATGSGGSRWANPMNSGNVFTPYIDCIEADPTVTNFWKMDDASGDLMDSIGSSDLADFPHSGYPDYQMDGPFEDLPEVTAVETGGGNFSAALASQAKFTGPSMPVGTTPFTLQGYLYLGTLTFGGTLLQDNQYIIWHDGAGTISVSRGAVVLTGFTVTAGTWYHFRLTYDGTTLRLYKDYVLVDSDTSGSVGASGGFVWMNNTSGVFYDPWNGRAALWSLHSDIASICPVGAGGSGNAAEHEGAWADGAGGVDWHLVQEENIDDDAVATDHVQDLAITTAKVNDLAITTGKLAASSVTAAKVAADVATQAELDAHTGDTSDAHDGSAISIADAGGYYTGTEVEAALQEVGADIAALVPANDTHVWMPLTTVVGGTPELVWDGDNNLIPTLIPI